MSSLASLTYAQGGQGERQLPLQQRQRREVLLDQQVAPVRQLPASGQLLLQLHHPHAGRVRPVGAHARGAARGLLQSEEPPQVQLQQEGILRHQPVPLIPMRCAYAMRPFTASPKRSSCTAGGSAQTGCVSVLEVHHTDDTCTQPFWLLHLSCLDSPAFTCYHTHCPINTHPYPLLTLHTAASANISHTPALPCF